jgi:hypothetical protein
VIRDATSHAAALVDAGLRNLAIAAEGITEPSRGKNAHLFPLLESAAASLHEADSLRTSPGVFSSSAQLVEQGLALLTEADSPLVSGGLAKLQQGVTHDSAIGMFNEALAGAQQGWKQLGVDTKTIHELGQRNAVWTAVDATTLLAARPTAATAEIERLMSRSTINQASQQAIGAPSTHHGQLYSYALESAASATVYVDRVVVKSSAQQAVQERFGFQIAKLLGIDHLFPVTILDSAGNARIQALPGTPQLSDLTGEGAKLFERLRTEWHQANQPTLSTDEARAAARMERQLLGVFDYILANADRHKGNVLIDEQGSTGAFIDSGLVGVGERGAGNYLLPALHGLFQGAAATKSSSPRARVNLDLTTTEYLRRRLDPEALRQLWISASREAKDVAAASPAPLSELDQAALGGFTNPELGHGMQARLTHLLSHGWYEVSPAEAGSPLG